ncbi:hypothetical protein LZZ85_06215 [Terrimonas sp. NA20]|uniref:Uncharacterized protein n=1 Tax=Terrimonas ginsenosidimutans TaxID=2908004 RepID=A0ABS9KNF5_9BACT|nr:hypothetical protein [Terrimonas ginsenosidimutans]MCG2613865.1 hypothetical protein [Terrimonas ginsenosidimutans]
MFFRMPDEQEGYYYGCVLFGKNYSADCAGGVCNDFILMEVCMPGSVRDVSGYAATIYPLSLMF